MNEKGLLESIHTLELKIVEVQGDIRAMCDKMDRTIETDTARLNHHSAELDDHSERLASLEKWEKSFESSIKNRIAISQSITTVAAVVIAYLLSKFL